MKSILLQGLAYGDESKGATVDALCRKFPITQLVRFGGGSQCAHNVVTPEGLHHTFSQFGSGMLANPYIKTHLSRFMLINPLSMISEANQLNKYTSNVWDRTTIDKKCVIITPMHKVLNQLRENSRETRHGSCGIGLGIARELQLKYGNECSLLAEDLNSYSDTFWKLANIHNKLLDEINELGQDHTVNLKTLAAWYSEFPGKIVDSLDPSEFMIFEGHQGVLLDEREEFLPHNTWTDCTFKNADTLLDEVGCKDRTRIGCFRSYFTRHGHGPFPTEDKNLVRFYPEPHNSTGVYQGDFRVGRFDFDLARKSLDIVGGVDYLSISHLDKIKGGPLYGHQLNTPVGIFATGPTYKDRSFSRDFVEKVSGVREFSYAGHPNDPDCMLD